MESEKKKKKPQPVCRPRLQLAVASDVGIFRKNNEDNFLMDHIYNERQANQYYYDCEGDLGVCRAAAVFDGMGGDSCGELASLTAAQMLSQAINRKETDDLKQFALLVRKSFAAINNRIVEYQNQTHTMIGTTGVAICTDGTEFKILYCGDSRAYLYRGGQITCLTRDHTLAAMKIAGGVYAESSPDAQKDKHSLTNFLGADGQMLGVGPEETEWYDLEETDHILLCSDGLTDACTCEDLAAVLGEKGSLRDKAIRMVNQAIAQGSRDNITCVLLMRESGRQG